MRYVLSKDDAGELRSEDGKRLIGTLGDAASKGVYGVRSGAAQGLQWVGRKGYNLFGWVADASAPMSCSQYTLQTCPLAPQYPTDRNFQLYRYKAGSAPVLGHCTLFQGKCKGRMGSYGLFRQGTPTYEQLLSETQAHLQRLG